MSFVNYEKVAATYQQGKVPEPATPISIVIERLVKMRHADSLLSALSDTEFDAGLAALRHSDERSVSGALHLAVFE